VLFNICLAWYIGASRFKDNRHHVSDIIAGARRRRPRPLQEAAQAASC
jgi:hypothetical protein